VNTRYHQQRVYSGTNKRRATEKTSTSRWGSGRRTWLNKLSKGINWCLQLDFEAPEQMRTEGYTDERGEGNQGKSACLTTRRPRKTIGD